MCIVSVRRCHESGVYILLGSLPQQRPACTIARIEGGRRCSTTHRREAATQARSPVKWRHGHPISRRRPALRRGSVLAAASPQHRQRRQPTLPAASPAARRSEHHGRSATLPLRGRGMESAADDSTKVGCSVFTPSNKCSCRFARQRKKLLLK